MALLVHFFFISILQFSEIIYTLENFNGDQEEVNKTIYTLENFNGGQQEEVNKTSHSTLGSSWISAQCP